MISVCIPTYNGEKYIQRQLDSILAQLAINDEVVISDDGSTDKTIEIIKGFQDKRIRTFKNEINRNPVLNLENALKQAKGDYIFLADQDDYWLPNKILNTLKLFEKYDLIVCNGYIVDQDENIIHQSYYDWKGSAPGFFKNLRKNSYIGCALAFNKKILANALPFPRHHIMHDFWIGMVAELTGRILFLDEHLFCYRRHSENFTAAIEKKDHQLSDHSFLFKIRYRILILIYLFTRILRIVIMDRSKLS